MKKAPLAQINIDQLRAAPGQRQASIKNGPFTKEENKINENGEQIFKLNELKFLKQLGGVDGPRKMLHVPTQKTMALKPYGNFRDVELLKKAKKELSVLKKLDSEYVIKYYGHMFHNNYLLINIEYMDKGSLADIIQQLSHVPEIFLGLIAFQCLKGLEYLHETQNMIHKAIKPSNILVNSEGRVKLADTDPASENYGQSGSIFYSSPEKCAGGKYSYDTDIWSLGLVIFECAFGRHPYFDVLNRPTQINWIDAYKIFMLAPVPELPDYFSLDLRDFLSKCLKKEMGTRSSVKELLEHSFVTKSAFSKKDLFKAWLEQV